MSLLLLLESATPGNIVGGSGWGLGEWGHENPWGTGSTFPAPGLLGASPETADVEGGTIITLVGTNFFAPVEIAILVGGGTPVFVASGILYDQEFDVRTNRIFFGAPALPAGVYHIQIATAGGPSNVLLNSITYRAFAKRAKILTTRGKYGPGWHGGSRGGI